MKKSSMHSGLRFLALGLASLAMSQAVVSAGPAHGDTTVPTALRGDLLANDSAVHTRELKGNVLTISFCKHATSAGGTQSDCIREKVKLSAEEVSRVRADFAEAEASSRVDNPASAGARHSATQQGLPSAGASGRSGLDAKTTYRTDAYIQSGSGTASAASSSARSRPSSLN